MEVSMGPTSLQGARFILADPMDVRIPRNISTSQPFMAAVTSPDLIALIIFCVLGLLVMVAVDLLVPNFGETIATIQTFL
jgi:hypothetical protein